MISKLEFLLIFTGLSCFLGCANRPPTYETNDSYFNDFSNQCLAYDYEQGYLGVVYGDITGLMTNMFRVYAGIEKDEKFCVDALYNSIGTVMRAHQNEGKTSSIIFVFDGGDVALVSRTGLQMLGRYNVLDRDLLALSAEFTVRAEPMTDDSIGSEQDVILDAVYWASIIRHDSNIYHLSFIVITNPNEEYPNKVISERIVDLKAGKSKGSIHFRMPQVQKNVPNEKWWRTEFEDEWE
jgi:hypothetical protein